MTDLPGLSPQDDDPNYEMVLSPASRERIIAKAQFVNGLGISMFATGVLGTLVAFAFAQTPSDDAKFIAVVFAFICFFGAIALHLYAQHVLGALDR